MSSNLIELQIAEDIKEIVKREVLKLKNSPELDKTSLMALEKVTKAYTMLMADLRENVKAGLFGKLDDAQLQAIDKSETAKQQGKSNRGRKPKGA